MFFPEKYVAFFLPSDKHIICMPQMFRLNLKICLFCLKARQIILLRFGRGETDEEIKQMLISLTFKAAECANQLQRYEQAYHRYREVLLLTRVFLSQMLHGPIGIHWVLFATVNHTLTSCTHL